MKEAILVTQSVNFYDRKKTYKHEIQRMDWFTTTYRTDVPISVSAYDFFNDELLPFVQKHFGKEGAMLDWDLREKTWIDDGTDFSIRRDGNLGFWEFTITTTYEPNVDYIDEDFDT